MFERVAKCCNLAAALWIATFHVDCSSVAWMLRPVNAIEET